MRRPSGRHARPHRPRDERSQCGRRRRREPVCDRRGRGRSKRLGLQRCRPVGHGDRRNQRRPATHDTPLRRRTTRPGARGAGAGRRPGRRLAHRRRPPGQALSDAGVLGFAESASTDYQEAPGGRGRLRRRLGRRAGRTRRPAAARRPDHRRRHEPDALPPLRRRSTVSPPALAASGSVASSTATLYRINPRSARVTAIDLGGGSRATRGGARPDLDRRPVAGGRHRSSTLGHSTLCHLAGVGGARRAATTPVGTARSGSTTLRPGPSSAGTATHQVASNIHVTDPPCSTAVPDVDRGRCRCRLGDGHANSMNYSLNGGADRRLRPIHLSPPSALPQRRRRRSPRLVVDTRRAMEGN